MARKAQSSAPVRGAGGATSKTTPTRNPAPSAKQAILEAALRTFARDGFDGASLPKIAEMAKVAHPLIHYHFRSKDNLWRETVEFAVGDLVTKARAIDTASRGLSAVDRLRILIQVLVDGAARYPDHFGLIMVEARSNSDRVTWLRENYTDPFLGHLMSILKDAQEGGQIKDIPLDHLSFILMGSAMLFFTLNFSLSGEQNMNELAGQHAKWVIEVFLNGAAR